MKTSWIETKEIDDYLHVKLAAPAKLLFEAQVLIDPERLNTIQFQQETYQLVRSYSRRQLKAEIESVHQTLFNDNKHTGFQKMIFSIFGRG